MFRFFIDMGVKLWVIGQFWRIDGPPGGYDNALQTVAERYGRDHPMVNQALILQAAQQRKTAPNESIEEILDLLEKAMTTPHTSASEGKMIGSLVSFLMTAYQGNRYGLKALGVLRKALLTREEVAQCEAGVFKEELTCASCKRSLRSGEVTVLVAMTTGPCFYCAQCAQPNWTACPTCKEGTYGLSPGTQVKLRTGICGACREKKNRGDVPAAEEQVPTVNQEAGTFAAQDAFMPQDERVMRPRAFGGRQVTFNTAPNLYQAFAQRLNRNEADENDI